MSMRIAPEIDGVSIVLLGSFNPAIFTPAWFALHSLLPKGVADSAELEVVHPQVTSFAADWLRLNITPERFQLDTVQAPHIRVHDLAVRVFAEHLPHTPLKAFGINRNVHFRVENLAARDHLGRTLAPVSPWGAWGQELGLDGEHGGMKSLTMSQYNPTQRPLGGQINVTVEPSNRVGEGRTGVFVRINDHYALGDSEPHAAGNSMELLETNFKSSQDRSESIIDHIMSLVPHGDL